MAVVLSTASRMAYGMSFSGPGQSGGNDGPMIDMMGSGTGDFVSDLSAYKAQGIKAILKFVGAPSNYQASDLSFLLPSWKTVMINAAARTSAAQMASFVTSGTLLANWIMDDCKPGSTIYGGKPPTLEDLDEMARFSKTLWPDVPCAVRVDNNYLRGKSVWSYLDFGWCQWHERFGPVNAWFQSNINDGRSVGLGTLGGFNLLNGGSGITAPWNTHPGQASDFGMSPMEIDAVTAAVSQNSYLLGVFGWSAQPNFDDTDYYSNVDIQAALQRMVNVVSGKTAGPINWRDKSPSGSTDTGSGSTNTVRGAWNVVYDGASSTARGNNISTLIVPAPPTDSYNAGDRALMAIYSRDSGRTCPSPSGWSECKRVSGNSAQGGELVLATKIMQAGEVDVTLNFTGNVGGTSQMARWVVVSGNSSTPAFTAGSARTWAAKTGGGPVAGVTSAYSDALVVCLVARTDDWLSGSVDENLWSNTTGPQTWQRVFSTGCASGADAAMLMDACATNGIESITSKSWTQNAGSTASGAGVGFMVAFAPAAIIAGTPPSLNFPVEPDVTLSVGSTLGFTLSSSGSTPITYSCTSGPSNVTINSSTGVFQFTPLSVSTSVIVLRADNDFGFDTGTLRVFAVAVAQAANTAPTITHPGNKTVTAHDLLSFIVQASDVNQDPITFRLDGGAPQGCFIDAFTGQFIWIPTGEQGPSVNPIVVLASDGRAESRSTFTVTVLDTPWTRSSGPRGGFGQATTSDNQFRRIT